MGIIKRTVKAVHRVDDIVKCRNVQCQFIYTQIRENTALLCVQNSRVESVPKLLCVQVSLPIAPSFSPRVSVGPGAPPYGCEKTISLHSPSYLPAVLQLPTPLVNVRAD